jgi:hypothetical protein
MGEIKLHVAQIINTLHKGDNKNGGDDDNDDDDDNNNIKLPEACLSFSVTPFIG